MFHYACGQVPPFFGAELCSVDGEMVIKGRGACDTKVLVCTRTPYCCRVGAGTNRGDRGNKFRRGLSRDSSALDQHPVLPSFSG